MVWKVELKKVSCAHLRNELDALVAGESADLDGEERGRIKVAESTINAIASSGRYWDDSAILTVAASWDGKHLSIDLINDDA